MHVVLQLLTPFGYLRVSGNGKLTVDLWIPLVLTVASFALFEWASPVPTLGERGMISLVNGLLQMLVGFYVAALAAVATFPSKALEQPALNLSYYGAIIRRRKLLSLLFGYAAAVSLSLYFVGVFALLAKTKLSVIATGFPSLRLAFIAIYLLCLWNLVCVTMLGFHYLIDRARRPDAEVLTGPKR